MKRKILLAILGLVLFLSAPLAAGDKLIFTEVRLSYGNAADPGNLSNNSTGVFDTLLFDIKAGVDFCKWADVYAAAGFYFFTERQNMQQHYSFFPVYGGIRANLMPSWPVYPDIFIEYGMAFANYHTALGYVTDDRPWTAVYYNMGIGVNWSITDISTLSLTVERPALSNILGAEIHIFKTGLAWKILY